MDKEWITIAVDVGHVETIMNRFGLKTNSDAVDLALRHLAEQPMTCDEALAMRGSRSFDEVPA